MCTLTEQASKCFEQVMLSTLQSLFYDNYNFKIERISI